MNRLDYLVTWNGQEYVAECPGIPDISGHSQLAVYALHALVVKLKEEGHPTGPISMKDFAEWKPKKSSS